MARSGSVPIKGIDPRADRDNPEMASETTEPGSGGCNAVGGPPALSRPAKLFREGLEIACWFCSDRASAMTIEWPDGCCRTRPAV
jgi:hypothetical protein